MKTMKKAGKTASMAVVLLMSATMAATAASSAGCFAEVQTALDKQRQAYINAYADMADQNFSRRPGTFASTTCLDRLMQTGGLDIFFKPPSLDGIVDMIKNFACEQASQIFGQVLGGGGIGGGSLNPGELIKGVNLGGGSISIGAMTGNGRISTPSINDLFR